MSAIVTPVKQLSFGLLIWIIYGPTCSFMKQLNVITFCYTHTVHISCLICFLIMTQQTLFGLQDVLKTSSRHVLRHWRHLKDVLDKKKLSQLSGIRTKEIVTIILKANSNLESWVTIITFLLQFNAEANQSRFPKFYVLLGAHIQ